MRVLGSAGTTSPGVRTPLPGAGSDRTWGMLSKILTLLLIALVPASVLAGGESEEEKATAQVCSARDNIAKQVDELKGLTLTTATTSQVRENLQAIRGTFRRSPPLGATSRTSNARTSSRPTTLPQRSGGTAATVGRSTSVEDAGS